MSRRAAIILGLTIIVATFLHAGVYLLVPVPGDSSAVFVVNRFTGSVTYCTASGCTPLGRPEEKPNGSAR